MILELMQWKYYLDSDIQDRRIVCQWIAKFLLKVQANKRFCKLHDEMFKELSRLPAGHKVYVYNFFLKTIQQFLASNCFNIAYHVDVEIRLYGIIGYWVNLISIYLSLFINIINPVKA